MSARPGLTFEQLLDWVEGRLAPSEAQVIAAQVAAADEHTQQEVAWLHAFQQASADVVLAAPPDAVRQALVARFAEQQNRSAGGHRSPGFFAQLLATLTFDSQRQPLVAGARHASLETHRQLVFSTQIADIVLNIQWREEEQATSLLGQVLPNQTALTPDLFCVQLLQETHEIGIIMANEVGEFAFEHLAPGRYQLNLSTADRTIALPSLDFQPPVAS